jgi:hypothetical protein
VCLIAVDLLRIVQYGSIEEVVLIALVVYFHRLPPSFVLTPLNVHRFIITAVLVGTKVTSLFL